MAEGENNEPTTGAGNGDGGTGNTGSESASVDKESIRSMVRDVVKEVLAKPDSGAGTASDKPTTGSAGAESPRVAENRIAEEVRAATAEFMPELRKEIVKATKALEQAPAKINRFRKALWGEG
jgi:hypothetical protein